MYLINKIVGWATSPLGVFFLCAGAYFVLAAVAARFEKRRKLRTLGRCLFGAAMVFLWVMSCGITLRWIGVGLEKKWETPGKPHGCIEALPSADAIVVLGGGMGVHRKCGAAEMFASADRVWQGARLYKSGKSKLVTLSGPDVENSTVPLLVDFGVPKEAMLYFSGARNTEEESKMIFDRLKRKDGGKPRILLVTSAWHMTRAKLLFERAGFEVVPAPTDFEMNCSAESPIRFADFFPSADGLIRNSYALKEWVGNVGYRFFRK